MKVKVTVKCRKRLGQGEMRGKWAGRGGHFWEEMRDKGSEEGRGERTVPDRSQESFKVTTSLQSSEHIVET